MKTFLSLIFDIVMMTDKSIYVFLVHFAINVLVGFAKSPEKIVNGIEIISIPYQVSLQTPSGSHFCGGTIIDARNILTAAHCAVNKKRRIFPFRTIIITGTNDKRNRTDQNVFFTIEAIIHASYNPESYINDIAILRTDRPIPFSRYQYALALPSKDTEAGTAVITSGWGATLWNNIHQVGDAFPRFLRKTEGWVVSQGMCQRSLSQWRIRSGHICFWSGSSTPCNRDSGGPLTDGIHVIGITSFNQNCDPKYPAVYTRVYRYLSWIKKAMSKP